MLTNSTNPPWRDEIRVPDDLRIWVKEEDLLKFVASAIWRSEAGRVHLPTSDIGSPDLHMVQTLVTYCYAIGLCGSQDIETAIYRNETLQQLCDDYVPDVHAIRHFRRHNRELIQRWLQTVFQLAWKHRFGNAQEAASENLTLSNQWLERHLGKVFSAAAEERLRHAIEDDSMFLDE